jgi:hypothetical protein
VSARGELVFLLSDVALLGISLRTRSTTLGKGLAEKKEVGGRKESEGE